MIEALWSVNFGSNLQGFGAGVAVLETGRVLGGDAQYTYVGAYSVSGGTITANVVIRHYFGPPSSIFGNANQFTLTLSGEIEHDSFEMSGHIDGRPDLQIAIRFTRRAELP